jgi:hypothetical protein
MWPDVVGSPDVVPELRSRFGLAGAVSERFAKPEY